MDNDMNLELFGLCAVMFLCTGIGYKAQKKCQFFKKLDPDKKASICKFKDCISTFDQCSHKESRALAFDHKDPEHHEAGMKETFLVRSAKYSDIINKLQAENKILKKDIESGAAIGAKYGSGPKKRQAV